MEKSIIQMFNNISPSDYYISNPYSSTCNKAFKRIFKSKDFLDYFYLLSNKTYERLALIAKVSEDSTKNTVFITGFRGCGKTCFMNLLNSKINSEFAIPEYDETKNEEKDMVCRMMPERKNEEMEKVETKYKKSAEKIINSVYIQMNSKNIKEKTKFVTYINETLVGKSVFLNFEKGNASNDELPFDKKFVLKIEDVVDSIIQKKGEAPTNSIFARMINLYKQHSKIFNNTFEYKNVLADFFEYCENDLLYATSFTKEKRKLNNFLNALNLEQLLCVLVLLHSTLELEEYQEGQELPKVFFLLDNMDIVYRFNILEESMHEYSNFIENMNSLMEELEGTEDYIWSKLYDKMTFIFAMRETTAMQIADHFIDGVEFVAKHFDISMDNDKALVVEKKYSYIKKYENVIENEDFKNNIYRIHSMCTDWYIKSNVFPMFNNDYKRAVACINAICQRNEKLIDQAIELSKTGNDFNKNGARGIIFRVIFDEFMRKRYFEKIGIETPINHNQQFTISRPVLTILYNLLPEYDQEEFVDEDNERLTPETISLKHLYALCKPIMGKQQFITALVGMFELKKAPTWNHLITFDNIKKVTYQELDHFLEDIENGNLTNSAEIELRITCAGANYIKFICTHFEFFSCRFTKNSAPLFAKKNELYSEKYGDYNFEYVIKHVYNAVVQCCNKLKQYNEKVINYQEQIGGVPLLESDYVFRSKQDDQGWLHEERIVHWHIGYIDNYRMHLIKDVHPDKIAEINKKIIYYIEKYVQLLDQPLMSDMSSVLYNEFTACIKYIKQKEYEDDTTQITRNSYKQLLKEGSIDGRT